MAEKVFLAVQQAARNELGNQIAELLKKSISKEDFADVMHTAFGPCGIAQVDFAKEFDLNGATLHRWAEGTNLPQPYVRPDIVEKLLKFL